MDSRACRRCLAYTDSFHAEYDRPRLATTFRASTTGTKRHLAAVEMHPRYFAGATHAACSSAIELVFSSETFTVDPEGAATDPRLCAHCRKYLWSQ